MLETTLYANYSTRGMLKTTQDVTSPEGYWKLLYMLITQPGGMLETTLYANYSTGEMLKTTQDANYSTGEMLETTQDANYSTRRDAGNYLGC